jgi:uncharacterized oxidoreductase
MAEIRVDPERLTTLVAAIVARGGSAPAEARLVAAHLVGANLVGHDSHGVALVPLYVRHLVEGLVSPNTPARLVNDQGPFLRFEGDRGFGRRVGGEALDAAILRAGETGVAVVTLAHAHHLGRIGAYGERAVAHGLVALLFVNVVDHGGLVAPFRGRDARFATNPVCLAVPGTAAQPPVILDMATSKIAIGKVLVARNRGESVPDGCLIDEHGQPTVDPDVMHREPRGALLPFGGHKGYGLAVLMELLAGGLSGGGTLQPEHPRRGAVINNLVGILLDPGRLAGAEWLAHEVEAFVAYVKASPPADAASPVLVPGDPERLAAAERRRAGIPLDATTWDSLLAAGETLGLPARESRDLVGAGAAAGGA